MTYRDACILAIEFGAKLAKFDHVDPVAASWIDRIEWLAAVGRSPGIELSLQDAIDEANRYA